MDDVNERFARVEQIKKFRMLPKELDHEDGELTATQKVKRTAIATMFADLVEDMYRDDRTGAVPGARARVTGRSTRCWRSASSSSTSRPG